MFYLKQYKESFGGDGRVWQIPTLAMKDRGHNRQWLDRTEFMDYFRYEKIGSSRSILLRRIVDEYCQQKHKVLAQGISQGISRTRETNS